MAPGQSVVRGLIVSLPLADDLEVQDGSLHGHRREFEQISRALEAAVVVGDIVVREDRRAGDEDRVMPRQGRGPRSGRGDCAEMWRGGSCSWWFWERVLHGGVGSELFMVALRGSGHGGVGKCVWIKGF